MIPVARKRAQVPSLVQIDHPLVTALANEAHTEWHTHGKGALPAQMMLQTPYDLPSDPSTLKEGRKATLHCRCANGVDCCSSDLTALPLMQPRRRRPRHPGNDYTQASAPTCIKERFSMESIRWIAEINGAPGGIRTPDLRVRSALRACEGETRQGR
jgi:hypothetical protein